jgi:hypothetical protein
MSDQPRPQRVRQYLRVEGSSIHRDGFALNGLPTRSVTRPHKWRNPYTVEEHGRLEAIRLFCASVAGRHAEIRTDLRGRNLACYCEPDEACHADVLLAIANAEEDA